MTSEEIKFEDHTDHQAAGGGHLPDVSSVSSEELGAIQDAVVRKLAERAKSARASKEFDAADHDSVYHNKS